MKKIGLILLSIVIYSSFTQGISLDFQGTVSASGYGETSFDGTGTFSLNSYKDNVVITVSNESSGRNKSGFIYWTDFFGFWDIEQINEHTIQYRGTGTFKVAGENIFVSVSRNQNTAAKKFPKTRVIATGKGAVSLTGQGTYSISKKIHDIALEAQMPTEAPLNQPFNATITVYNNGEYSEKTELRIDFNYIGDIEGCSNTFSFFDVLTPVGAKNTSLIELIALCPGPYELKVLGVNLDTNPFDNNDSKRLNDNEYYLHDLAIIQILVPDQVLAGESFVPGVKITNLGDFVEEARLGGFINPLTNHSCPITNMPLTEFTLQPGESHTYEYQPLSFTCISEYSYSANLLNSDDSPGNNFLQKTFEVIPAENTATGKSPNSEQTPLETPVVASLTPFIAALQKAFTTNKAK